MPVYVCPRCSQCRSRARGQLCNVCWLLDDLLLEHDEGLHKTVNPSCGKCKPRHDAHIRQLSSQMRPVTSEVTSLIHHTSSRREKPRDDLSTPKQRQSSHAACEHDNTKAARAKCRATRRSGGS